MIRQKFAPVIPLMGAHQSLAHHRINPPFINSCVLHIQSFQWCRGALQKPIQSSQWCRGALQKPTLCPPRQFKIPITINQPVATMGHEMLECIILPVELNRTRKPLALIKVVLCKIKRGSTEARLLRRRALYQSS